MLSKAANVTLLILFCLITADLAGSLAAVNAPAPHGARGTGTKQREATQAREHAASSGLALGFAAGMGFMAAAMKTAPYIPRTFPQVPKHLARFLPPPPPPSGGGGSGGSSGNSTKTIKSIKGKDAVDPWWERLPGGWMNPICWWWRVKQKGPYTRYYINHVNPLSKIVAFSMKEMLPLQMVAFVGQVSVLLDKGLRPKITNENWWSIRYYAIFAFINLRRILGILHEQRPVAFNKEELELYELLFKPNQFSPRQFNTLKDLGEWRLANNTNIVEPGQQIRELLVVVSGQCEVTVGGQRANIIRPGDFVGELEFLSVDKGGRHPESESDSEMAVVAKGVVRYLVWSFEVLDNFLYVPRNKQIALKLEAVIAKDIANKLLETEIKTGGTNRVDEVDGFQL